MPPINQPKSDAVPASNTINGGAKRIAIRFPEELPVSGQREVIMEALRSNQVVIVCGETGSGKTTQLPKICLELGRGTMNGAA
jgi:ATP-dependent helicase HrpA